ncbi:MAG: metal-sulfur cluster assembly factor [Gemmobacter sp.]
MSLPDTVWKALGGVIDPEMGRSIVDLGLVYRVGADASGRVDIVMTTTTPGCPLAGVLAAAAEAAALSVPGVQAARARLSYDPPWDPGRAIGRSPGAGGPGPS